jgi:hypothetical protein
MPRWVQTAAKHALPKGSSSGACIRRRDYTRNNKTRPTRLRRRAGFTSAGGCPGRHLGAASLSQPASWAAFMLAGRIGLVLDMERRLS